MQDNGKQHGDHPLIEGLGGWRISDERERRRLGKLHSDDAQRDTILSIAASKGIEIVGWFDESNVPGGTPLEKRPYNAAIQRVEDPNDPVQAIVFAYRSRHDRSILEGAKAITRMDRADGVLLVGGTTLTHKTATKWGESTMGSMFTEWHNRELRENIEKGVAKAVADGRVPGRLTMLGLEKCGERDYCGRKNADGVPCDGSHNHVWPSRDKQAVKLARQCFEMRGAGSTVDEVRLFLRTNGVKRSYQAVQRMLKSPLYIAQLRYGGTERPDGSITPEYINEDLGFRPVVDPALWERVQAMSTIAGRNTKRPHLLARLSVLLCGTCGARMTIVSRTNNGVAYDYYRCGQGRIGDCAAPPSISAPAIEQFVLEAAARESEHVVESDSAIREVRDADEHARALEDAAEDAEAKFVTLGPGRHTRARAAVDAMQAEAVAAREHADALRDELGNVDHLGAAALLRSTDRADLPDQRDVIRSIMKGRVRVMPDTTRGRTPVADRVTIAPRRKARRAAAA